MLATLLAQTLSKSNGNYTMNDATLIRSAMTRTATLEAEAVMYTPAATELYTAVVDLCTEAAATGEVHRRFIDWPITCTDEIGLAVLRRLRSQRFEVIDRMYLAEEIRQSTWYATNKWFTVGWSGQHDLPCDAIEVQLCNPEMVQAATNRTVKRIYSTIVDACNTRSHSGYSSNCVDMERLINANWDKNIPVHSGCMAIVFKLVQEKLVQQGFKVDESDVTDLICVNW